MSASSANAAGVGGRYATALFDLARENEQLDRVGDDMDALHGVFADDPDFARVLASPMVARHTKAEVAKTIGEKAGFAPLTINFLGVLGRQDRLGALPDIVGAFRTRLADHRGRVTVEVISAIPLAPHQESAVKDLMSGALGKEVSLDATVDAELLGGLVVRVGSRMIDASLKTKLRHLERAMRGSS